MIQQTYAHYLEAEQLYQRALTLYEVAYGSTDLRTIRALGDVAGIVDEHGYYDQAQSFYEKAAQLSEQHAGPEHADTALAFGNLARFYRVIGKSDQAEQLFLKTLAIYERGPDLDTQMAITLNNFAYLKLAQKQYEQAETLLRRAIQLNRARMSHPSFAANLKNLASALQGCGESVLASLLCQQA